MFCTMFLGVCLWYCSRLVNLCQVLQVPDKSGDSIHSPNSLDRWFSIITFRCWRLFRVHICYSIAIFCNTWQLLKPPMFSIVFLVLRYSRPRLSMYLRALWYMGLPPWRNNPKIGWRQRKYKDDCASTHSCNISNLNYQSENQQLILHSHVQQTILYFLVNS